MRRTYLDFEDGLRSLDRARDAARAQGDAETEAELVREMEESSRRTCAHLTPWQRVQMSRHIDRPFTLDYVAALCTDFVELHGDRTFGDDAAVVAGLALRGERAIAVVGHQRGRGTAEKVRRNFGMPRPEGYRKARRLFRLAARTGLGLLTLVDTQGAFPGTESEERGIAEAIAGCIAELAGLPVPVVSVVIGEGGSGGALALAVSDALLMLEHSCLAVISPEGCASILERQRSPELIARAADSLALTAPRLLELGIADEVVTEPVGGAHRAPAEAIELAGAAIDRAFARLDALSPAELRARRDARLRAIGGAAVR
ncbi:MAG: acetyl-CoA carboxylase carboxyltransferase subunit alpha [Deltaproteobacteria bacterium]|nr:acetyl-CoA carboxylase carboxyltransferase subunit alpha [Deltaproteobacteria bacterium]